MWFLRMMVVALVGLGLSGCSAWTETSGGGSGALQDKAFFEARNDQDYLYRAMAITAALSKIATGNTQNQGNTKQAIAQINGLMDTLSAMQQTAQAMCGAKAKDMKAPQSLKDCDDGFNRQRFQSLTADVDGQLVNLVAVAFKTDELKSLFENIAVGNVVGALWDLLSASGDIAVAANKAFAVYRMGAQGRAYVLAFQDDGAEIVNIQQATDYLKARKEAKRLDSSANTVPYQVAMHALFQDIRESCYSIRSTLSTADKKNINCPRSFAFTPKLAGQCLSLKGVYFIEDDIIGYKNDHCDCDGKQCVSMKDAE
ncbi:exported hypothetical protein [Magnetospirillum sp. LM-5]|uniref:hypothetical protein n=1 Tax=Magnetospirillum sp. LM-5 TaxID=2681466 RepID=UPI00137D82A5|nr:hypothetical protein [Magnetospirillum sp. LM-5]CAA7619952.1 exported hypothetical protein [Magnetospirillum sp. LM-5]